MARPLAQVEVCASLEDNFQKFQLADLQLNYLDRGCVDFKVASLIRSPFNFTPPWEIKRRASAFDGASPICVNRSTSLIRRGGFDRARFDLGRVWPSRKRG